MPATVMLSPTQEMLMAEAFAGGPESPAASLRTGGGPRAFPPLLPAEAMLIVGREAGRT